MCMVLHQHDHDGYGHTHGTSSKNKGNKRGDEGEEAPGTTEGQQREKRKKETRNINVRAAFIHVIGDLVQSIGVLIAGYIISFWVHYSSISLHI